MPAMFFYYCLLFPVSFPKIDFDSFHGFVNTNGVPSMGDVLYTV
jgi:hypothetical protein